MSNSSSCYIPEELLTPSAQVGSAAGSGHRAGGCHEHPAHLTCSVWFLSQCLFQCREQRACRCLRSFSVQQGLRLSLFLLELLCFIILWFGQNIAFGICTYCRISLGEKELGCSLQHTLKCRKNVILHFMQNQGRNFLRGAGDEVRRARSQVCSGSTSLWDGDVQVKHGDVLVPHWCAYFCVSSPDPDLQPPDTASILTRRCRKEENEPNSGLFAVCFSHSNAERCCSRR